MHKNWLLLYKTKKQSKMKKGFLLLLISVFFAGELVHAQEPRSTINLNGTWEFDQTSDAFPPKKFTRTIPVPGLITMASPVIDDYNKFVKRPGTVVAAEQHNLYDLDYTPRYSWYRKNVAIAKEMQGKEVTISIKKSQYVTQVFVNGIDMGTSMACYTPVEFRCTAAVKWGAENEILIRVGDRVWLPSEAAGGTDKEKEHYLPGIWDDVALIFTGDISVNRLLVLPSVAEKKIKVKALVRNFRSSQIYYGDAMNDSVNMTIVVKEKKTGKELARVSSGYNTRRDNLTEVEMDVKLSEFTEWSPENPFLYDAEVLLTENNKLSDKVNRAFGMRDFSRQGKFFYLNGNQYMLRGTNITLQRFFEDPDSRDLVWNREWVKKLLIDIPKQLNWNMMRICVGIVPDFWYDIADEYGIMFQNEWLYWQNHGWNDQIRKEYTGWVWTDGCHPSIAIWDAINENEDDYIGNFLIPELKKLDPTRVWDAGYMTGNNVDEMDEPHPYQGPWNVPVKEFEMHPYPLGDLNYKPGIIRQAEMASTAQLVNEYGWIWLWRNGTPSKLTLKVYEYYMGSNTTPAQNRELQAYWLQLETEWLRSNTSIAGVLAFCYLANNYGYTGDWFIDDIKDLKPGLTLAWFKHCFAPAAVFINLTDERYMKQVAPHVPGSELLFDLAGINNQISKVSGQLNIKLINSSGINTVEKKMEITLDPLGRTDYLTSLDLPDQPGGYLMVAAFKPDGSSHEVISRRFIRIGNLPQYSYFELEPEALQ
jgi:beta-galactosidase